MRKQSFLFLVVVASQMGATKCGQVLRDPGFDLWCGEDLCAWKLERGEIKRVPTWHEADAGVELVGGDVAIEQLAPVNSIDGNCIRFDLVANIAETAEVYLNVDVEGDGTLEMHERLPTSSWKPLSYNIFLETPYDGIRFEITKRGTGEVVLANIGADLANGNCANLTPLDPGPRRPGAACVNGTDCASGTCIASPTPVPADSWFNLACAGCTDTSCGAGQVCGIGNAFSPVFAVPIECVAAGSKETGEKCQSGAECASGACPSGTCSGCGTQAACPTGQTCGSSWSYGPFICGAGQGLAASGAPCGEDADCASGHCNGSVRMECDDGRPCTSPAQCPFDDQLKNGACTTVGIQGGTCQ
jgi:hypothetical protein